MPAARHGIFHCRVRIRATAPGAFRPCGTLGRPRRWPFAKVAPGATPRIAKLGRVGPIASQREDNEFKGEDWGYRVVNLTFEWLYGSALLSGACLGLFGFVKLIKWMWVA